MELELVRKSGFSQLDGQWLEIVPKNGQTSTFFDFQEVELTLYIPQNRPAKKLPLLVMMHGCNQTAQSFAAGTRMNLYAEAHGFAVLYPHQNNFRNLNNCWHWFNADERYGLREKNSIVTIIAGILQHDENLATEDITFDMDHVYIAGLSSGAALAGQIIMEYSHLFKGAFLHSCPMFPMVRNAAGSIRVMKEGMTSDIGDIPTPISYLEDPLPVMIMHGEKDDYVNPINSEQLCKWFRRLNRMAGQYLQEPTKTVKCKTVPSLWHGWANGDPEYRYHEESNVDASKELITFFGLNKVHDHTKST